MTRSDLISALSARSPRIVAEDTETRVLPIEIRGFGSFALTCRPLRTAHNPKNGETVEVAARHAPHFKPGKALRMRVDETAAGS